MNERIKYLREQALATYTVDDEESERLWRESIAATEGESEVIRHAKAFAHHCRNRAISIREGDLIEGAQPAIRYGDRPAAPRISNRVNFDSPWWKFPAELMPLFRLGFVNIGGNHSTMNFASIIERGFDGRIRRAESRRQGVSDDEHDAARKREFLDALAICGRGYLELCARYGSLAHSMAESETRPARAAELRVIAENCRRVPAQPPRSFWEACQSLWFSFMFVPDACGRIDQYLAPFYRRGIASGELTRDFAEELLGCLWLKYFEQQGACQGVGAVHHLTLGGVNADGSDASNELTELCLEVTENLRIQRPQVGLRWNRNMPQRVAERAVRVLRTNAGNPNFCNDEQIVHALVRTGVSLEDARDFSMSGCHEIIVTGKAQMGSVEGFINLPKILRAVLGLEPEFSAGAPIDSLTSFEKLLDACDAEIARVADGVHQISVFRDKLTAGTPDLACSLVVDDCIERAKGYTQGGARYNHCNWDIVGIANLADSLAVMKKLVYEEQCLTLAEFVQMLRANWAGAENTRNQAINDCSHFGNDDDAVDSIAAGIVARFDAAMKKHKPFRGGEYILGTLAGAENMHVEFGRVTGATPDGRRAGEPLADSMGAAQGRDTHGVTAMLNSVAKLPHELLPTASTLNVRLDPKFIATDEGVAKMAALIRSHFLAGGQQLQFSMVNRQMLLDAQKNPERHAGLMVRVAGYSAPFVTLWHDLQAEIISRTEHSG